ncbi:MAG TPA: protoporphyrinogen oxidase [Bryobacteraceae bacterium]|nr:protoporphyrinogen oxidase [Bryobacteraceae bacterium]
MSSAPSAIVVGGGISGLSAAYYLTRAGIPVVLIEREARLGGVMQTDSIEGCTLELGPDSFLAAKPWALDLIRELGLAGEVIASNDHLRKSYILRHGRLVPLPDGLMMVVPTKVMPLLASSLLGWGTKIRMGLEWLRRPPGAALPDRSVAEFLRDHYGQESVDYLGEPLLSGVYGGDPAQLSVQSVLPRFAEMEAKHGSLTRAVLAARGKMRGAGGPLFQSLKGGLAVMADAIARAAGERLTVVRGAVEALERADGGWRVRVGGEWMGASHVVLACRAYQSAELARGLSGEMADLLAAVPYTSSMTLALGYRRTDVKHPLNGFGFLVPKAERGLLLGCTWLGTKFPHRVPDDKAVLRCFMAGDSLKRSDDDVIFTARAEIRQIMGVDAEPTFARIARWPQSMAQYTVGHAVRVARIESLAAGLPGLHLAGSAYHGIGVPDCIKSGKTAGEAVAKAG